MIRVLPPEEWSKLRECSMDLMDANEAVDLLQQRVGPKKATVIVAEEDGRIIGCIAVLRATQLEAFWVDKEHRNPGVLRGLSMAALDQVREDESWAFCAVNDPTMGEYLQRLGGVGIPTSLYVLSVR